MGSDRVPPGQPGGAAARHDLAQHPRRDIPAGQQVKGAAVLNMLRYVVGDENFFKILNQFSKDNTWKSVNTDDFRKAVETVTGKNLEYFFIQWIESSGTPEFKLEYTVYRVQKGFRVMGKIAQDLDTFRMPVDLKIETEGNPETTRVEVVGTSSEFSVDTFGKHKNIVIDLGNHSVGKTERCAYRRALADANARVSELNATR